MYNIDVNKNKCNLWKRPSAGSPYQMGRVLEGTECTAAWCSVDNWQPLTCGVYFLWGAEREQRRETSSVVQGECNYLNFPIDYLIRN